MKLSVIIPALNEEATIKEVIKKVLKQPHVFEVIIVDDGSKDATQRQVKSIRSKRVRLISHKYNKGKGAAVVQGIKSSKGDHIIIQDADSELNPNDISRMVKPLIEGETDFVIGNRWSKKRKTTLVQFGNSYFRILTNLLYRTNISDPYCCYKAASTRVWKSLKLVPPPPKGFEIEAEIVAKVALNKYSIKEIPISYNPRTYEQGKHIRAIDAYKGTKKLLQLRLKSFTR